MQVLTTSALVHCVSMSIEIRLLGAGMILGWLLNRSTFKFWCFGTDQGSQMAMTENQHTLSTKCSTH